MKKRVWISLAMAVLIAFSFTWSGRDQTPERDDLIRLHVIANSDSPEDQALKLRIRDQLLLSFGKTFQETRSMSQAREVIRKNLDEMASIARAEIQRSGYDYPVRMQLGIFPFPTKAYGDVVYPAGSYEALRIVIGKGTGANWWCVMFPPLCFVDVSGGVAKRPAEEAGKPEGEAKEIALKSKVQQESASDSEVRREPGKTAGEMDPAGPEQESATRVVYTFKVVEWWKSVQAWAAHLFS